MDMEEMFGLVNQEEESKDMVQSDSDGDTTIAEDGGVTAVLKYRTDKWDCPIDYKAKKKVAEVMATPSNPFEYPASWKYENYKEAMQELRTEYEFDDDDWKSLTVDCLPFYIDSVPASKIKTPEDFIAQLNSQLEYVGYSVSYKEIIAKKGDQMTFDCHNSDGLI